jgi:hypothetical protein
LHLSCHLSLWPFFQRKTPWLDIIQIPNKAKKIALTYKQSLFVSWKTKSCCSQMFQEAWSICNACRLYYQPPIRKVKNQTCPVLVGTTNLDLDMSCNANGPKLFLDLAPCFLVLITIKCTNNLVIMEAQKILDFSALACFMDKKLVQ